MFQIHFSCCFLYLYCKVLFREKFSCLTLNYKVYIHRFCCLSWFFCKSKKSAPVSLQHSSTTLTSKAKYLLKCIHSSMLTRQEEGILAIFPFWKLNIFICSFSTKWLAHFLIQKRWRNEGFKSTSDMQLYKWRVTWNYKCIPSIITLHWKKFFKISLLALTKKVSLKSFNQYCLQHVKYIFDIIII